jgi:hypothetical protein
VELGRRLLVLRAKLGAAGIPAESQRPKRTGYRVRAKFGAAGIPAETKTNWLQG